MKKSRNSVVFTRLRDRLLSLGMNENDAGELAYHLMELGIFSSRLSSDILEITKLRLEKRKMKSVLSGLSEELDYHISPNHLTPARKLLRKASKL